MIPKMVNEEDEDQNRICAGTPKYGTGRNWFEV